MPIKKHTLAFLLILSALMAFTSLSVDIYLPALPAMSHDLRGDAELTVTGFLIGFTLAQLIWGPVADRIGRKTPLAVGMLLFTVGSIGCALLQTLPQIVFWRVFQAFGACVGPMLSRAMIRDLFGASQAARLLSTLVMIMAVAPIVGPLLGGVLLKIASWHAHFWLLAAIGALMFAAVFRLPESLPATRRARTPLWTAFADYRRLLTNRPFMRYTLCVTFFYIAAYAFITGSPKVYIGHFGIAPEYYGFWFGANIIGDLCKKALPSTARTKTQVFCCFCPQYLLILPKYPLNPPRTPPHNQASGPPFRRQQAHLACWPLSTGLNTSPSDGFAHSL